MSAGAAWRAMVVVVAVGGACAPLPPPAPPGSAPPPQEPLAAQLLAFVPVPAEALLSVDVGRLRDSPWAKPVLVWAAERERAGEGGRRGRGFDEIADVDGWVFARVGSPAAGWGTLELARGRFQPRLVLEAFAGRRPDARPTSFAERPGAADAEQAVVLLDARTVAFGPPAAVRAAAALAASGRSDNGLPWLGSVRGALDDEAGGGGRRPVVELAFQARPEARRELSELLGSPSEVPLDRLGGRLFLGVEARAVLVGLCAGRPAAEAVAGQLSEQLRALSDRRSVRALGLSPVLRRAVSSARGARVILELAVTEQERALVSDKLAAVAALLAAPR